MTIDYKESLEIDKSNLDVELSQQAERYMKWAELHVEAISARDEAKANLDVVKAMVDNKIRQEGGKLTEALISAKIQQDKDYQIASEAHITAQKNTNMLLAGREALAQRKDCLKMLAELWIAGYYATPKVDNELNAKMAKRKKGIE